MAALLIDPGDAHAHATIGQLFLDAGRDEEAVRAFTRALELKPDAYEARYALATAFTRLGKTVEASRQLELFESERRKAQERRRRDIADGVEPQEACLGPPVRAAPGEGSGRSSTLGSRSSCSPRGLVAAAAAPASRSSAVCRHRRQAGIAFRHTNGASAEKHLVETMGSGGVFFDYDGDGWIDIFLVDGGSIADAAVAQRAHHRLYHNRGDGTFEDVTERSGIHHREYGMGACAGDDDGDGRPDLYITNYGPNVLYRNRGDGTFADVTAAARVGDPRWSAGCAFADLDRDGDLDLWVVNYVDADRAHSPFCGERQQTSASTVIR